MSRSTLKFKPALPACQWAVPGLRRRQDSYFKPEFDSDSESEYYNLKLPKSRRDNRDRVRDSNSDSDSNSASRPGVEFDSESAALRVDVSS